MAETGTVQIKHSPGQERYEAAVTGADGTDVQVGYLDYVAEIEQVVLTHTVIFERFSGQWLRGSTGQGGPRRHPGLGQKVVPVCSYVEAYVGRHPNTPTWLSPYLADGGRDDAGPGSVRPSGRPCRDGNLLRWGTLREQRPNTPARSAWAFGGP